MSYNLCEWLNEGLHMRRTKAIMRGLPFAFTIFTTITALFSFSIGDYYTDSFPLLVFWVIAVSAIVLLLGYAFWQAGQSLQGTAKSAEFAHRKFDGLLVGEDSPKPYRIRSKNA